MATPNKFAIQEVFDVTLKNNVNNQPYCILEELKESTFLQEATTVYATGGKGNTKLIGFDHSKMAKFVIKSATYQNDLFEIQSGVTPVVGTSTLLNVKEILTVSSDVATTTFTPVGTVGSEVPFIYIKNTDRTFGVEYTQAAIPVSGEYSVSGKTITFFAGDIADDTEVWVLYNATAGSTTKLYTGYTDVFSKQVKLIADGIVKDCEGTAYQAQIIFYNAKVNNNFTLALTADGEVSVQDLEVEALKSCGDTKLWDLIIYDNTETT